MGKYLVACNDPRKKVGFMMTNDCTIRQKLF